MLLPLLFLAAFPGWVVKMLRRGGFGTRLGERAAIYTNGPREFEPYGAVHIHAVSVGEALLALKLIREWLRQDPERRFVLATGTATGHAVATAAAHRQTCASPTRRWISASWCAAISIASNRARIVLIEGEAGRICCSPAASAASRSRWSMPACRRARHAATASSPHGCRPLFSMLDAVAIQETEDAEIWRDLGVPPERIHHTGSLKFDPAGGAHPVRRPEFQEMLDAFGENRRVVLAASTHAGEDAWIADAIRDAAPHALPVIVPRHAERRD